MFDLTDVHALEAGRAEIAMSIDHSQIPAIKLAIAGQMSHAEEPSKKKCLLGSYLTTHVF